MNERGLQGAVVAPAPSTGAASEAHSTTLPPPSPETTTSNPPPAAPPTLSGHWVYALDPGERVDPKLFPADYVELTILVSRGTLRGGYRSRYRVPDRATSPFVNFTFEGPANATSFAWRDDLGAAGNITLQPQPSGALHVSWAATAMGSGLGLGSGTATLYRFR